MNNPQLKTMLLLNAVKLPYRLIDDFILDNPEALYLEAEPLWERLNFPQAVRQRLRKLLDADWAEREMERLERGGVGFVSIRGGEYPSRLRNIHNPPVGLYVKGSWNSKKSSVGIVGTRRCSPYGRHVTSSLAEALSNAGICVVSGGAAGIDAAAHLGCVAAGGTTAAVFGTGIDVVYPTKHAELFERIAGSGALITEYPFGAQGNAWRFPERNRIIAGLSDRLVVAEAPVDSGAMITARYALEAGIEIWSVPGHITDRAAHGTNLLLRDGANVLADIAEFVEIVGGKDNQRPLPFPKDISEESLTADETAVLQILRAAGNRTLDDIMAAGKMNLPQAQFCLSSLIASDLVSLSGPGRFSAAEFPRG